MANEADITAIWAGGLSGANMILRATIASRVRRAHGGRAARRAENYIACSIACIFSIRAATAWGPEYGAAIWAICLAFILVDQYRGHREKRQRDHLRPPGTQDSARFQSRDVSPPTPRAEE